VQSRYIIEGEQQNPSYHCAEQMNGIILVVEYSFNVVNLILIFD
jgi:hypothetical protein